MPRLSPCLLKFYQVKKKRAKLELLYKVLIDWQAVTKTIGLNSDCPWYQHTIKAQRLRTLFGFMAKKVPVANYP